MKLSPIDFPFTNYNITLENGNICFKDVKIKEMPIIRQVKVFITLKD